MFSITFDMSKRIVSQRPFSHKKHKRTFKRILNRSGIEIPKIELNPKIKNILSWWMLFIVLVICWIIFIVKTAFFNKEQTISQVKFSDGTLDTYQDIELFNLISEEVKWKNYFVLLSNKDDILTKIQKKFPFVWKIELQLEPKQEIVNTWVENIIIWIDLPTEIQDKSLNPIQTQFPLKLSQKNQDEWWTLWVQLMYYEPTALIQLNDKKYAVWDENTYVEIKEWMLLWLRVPTEEDPNPEQLITIETPKYLSWTTSLDWFFFEIGLSKMLQIASLAKEEFWNNMLRFVYLAWSTRFAIFTSDQKTLYFNFPDWWNVKDQRASQIFKYKTLRDKYSKFYNVWTIDLWSLEENKTIIRQY